MQLLDIPAAVLVLVLQHVPLQQRLGVCTRVCHAFYTAAVAATDSISIGSMSSQAQCDNVSEWLKLHGAGITCLDMRGREQGFLACSPCPALMDINLEGLSLPPRFFSACTSLTKLKLTGCYVRSSPHAISGVGGNPLAQLPVKNLQHLDVGAVSLQRFVAQPAAPAVEMPSDLLSQLVQLTCLKLPRRQVLSDAALQHLSALSALQHLEVNLRGRYLPGRRQQKPTAAALTGLQQLPQLTALVLVKVPWAINLYSLPAFTVLTALRVLQLQGSTSVDPAVLATISQLQQLDLACQDPWDANDSAAMLAAIGQQQGLIKLKVNHQCHWSTPSAAAYSALTASSHLQHLELQSCEFPAGAWQQMFPPTRCLPELSRLFLHASGGPAQPLSQADIQAMASCCPSLVSLYLMRQLPVTSATPLQQLTGLKTLGLCASVQDSAPSIAQLTGLQDLLLISSGQADQVTVSGLLQLTALQQLRDFGIKAAEAAWEPGLRFIPLSYPCLQFSSEASDGAPPDVWRQLKIFCEAIVCKAHMSRTAQVAG